MNKIYKIIWSKARNCYVVVSELAKRNGKASSGLNKKIIAAFLAAGTVMAVNGSAWADYSNVDITQANDKTITKTYYGNAESNAIAIGAGTGDNAAKALAEDSIAIGAGATAAYEKNVVIGAKSTTTGQRSTAIGADSTAFGYCSVAIGYDAQALVKFASSSDPSDPSHKSRAVAIGAGSRALANRSVAIGDNAIAERGMAWVVSIGANSYSGLLGANANGYGARAFGKNSVAMGRQARAGEPATDLSMNDATTYVTSKGNMDGFGAVAIGYMADAKKNGSFAVGYKAQAHGVNSMAFGSGQAQTDSDFVNITKALGDNSIAFGYNSRALANNAVSFGAYTEATGQRSLVFGTSGTDAVASGMGLLDNSRAAGQGSIAIGDRAVVDSNILVQSDAPDASVNDAISIGTEAHVRARNAVAIGGNISYTNDDNETVYGRSHNGRDFGALVGEGADSAIAIGGATLDESTSDFTTGTLAVKYEAAASLGKRGVAIGSGALVSGGDAFARYKKKINSTDYQNAKLAFEAAESEYLNATMQVSMKETEIASLDPSSADYETKKTRLEGELAALTKTAGEKLAALNEARPKWQEQETAALYLQKGNAEADADAIAIGTNARAGIKNSIALGKDAQTGDLAESSIAIGEGAVTGKDAVRAIAIGKGSTVNGADSIAVGHGHTVNGKNSGTFGDPNIVNADNTYVVGNNSTVEKNITNAFVFGNDVTVNNGTLPDGWYTLSDDDKANQTGYGVIAIGNNVTASLNENVSRESGTPKVQHVAAIGDNAVVGEENAVAIGFGAKSIAYNSVSVGTGAVSNAENAMAFGNNASATVAGGVALGSGALANRAAYNASTNKYTAYLGDESKTSEAWRSTESAIAVGASANHGDSATVTRQITGVAAGTYDTDAVNVAQLRAASAGSSMDFGGDNTTATDNIITVKGGEQLNVKGGAADLTDGNIGIVADKATKTLNVKLSNKINLNDDGYLVIGKTTDEKGQTVVDQNGVTLYPSSSATGSEITKFTKNGISAGGQKVENVAAGTADTDAVNVGQLKKARTRLVAGANVANVNEVVPTDADGNYSYTIDVDDLSYKANGANETGTKSVKLSDGLNFVDGTNTKAEVAANGVVKINAYKSVVQAKAGDGNVTVTPTTSADGFTTTYDVSVKDMHVDRGTASYGTDGTGKATLTHKDGTTAEVTGLKNNYTTGVTYNTTDKTATFNRNDGGSYALSLKDMGATDYRLVGDGVSHDQAYQMKADGTVTLNVQDQMNPDNIGQITIEGLVKPADVAAAKTEVVKGTNVTSVVKTTGTDNQSIYTVNVDDLTYQVGTNAAKNVSLKNGLHFVDGTNTTAVQNEDGSIQFNATHNRLTGVTVTPASDSSNAMTAELADADGNKTTVNLQNTYTTGVTYNTTDKTATFNRNDGGSYALSLKDMGATDYRLVGDGVSHDQAYQMKADGTVTLNVQDQMNPDNIGQITIEGLVKPADVAAAKTEVVKGTNVTSVVKTTGTDNQSIYTVNVDDLTYQVGTNAAKNVSLKNGLHFVDGTNTTAVQNEDGSIQFNATHNRLTGVTVTPASDSSNAMTAELADADGNKTTVNLQNTYTTVTKSGNTITFRRNDGVSESISLSDLGATDYRLVPAADGKYKVNGDGSLTLQVKDARNEGAAAVDVKIEDIASKTQQDINTSNIAANRADLDAGWTATVGNNTINVNPEHNGLSFASSDDHVTVTADGRTIKVGVQNLADTGLGNITEEGKTVITNLARDAVTVQGENGIEVTRSADKSTYTVKTKLGDNLTLREGNIDLANTVKIGNGADMHTVIVDGTKGEVTGLTNTTWSKDGAYNAGRAATEEQLKDVYEAAKGDALGSVKLKFQGESGDTLERGNNEILQIVGDESNITTKAEDGKLKVELSKDLNVNSVTAGNTVINDDGVTADKVTVGGTTIEDKKITVGDTVIDGTSVKAGDTTINNDGLTIDGGPSVTKGGIDAGKKKITGVAAGVAGTDAVNVDQLKEATSGLRTEVKGGTNVTVTKDTTTAADGHTIYTVNADGAKVSEADGGAVTVTGAKDTTTNITDYKVDLSDTAKASLDKVEKDGLTFKGDTGTSNKIKLGDTLNIKGGASGALSDGNIGVEGSGDTLNIKLAKDIKGVDTIRVNKSITAGDTVITGDGVTANTFRSGATVINNEGVTATKFTAGETSVSSNGLAIEGGPSVTKGGIDGGGKQVTNVAAGENDTDAATFGQLKDLAAGAGQAINNVSNEISRVDSRMKKELAGAAALAALHPIDTDDKFTMGLGYGNYRNAHAGAIGVFYRPTEKIMLSVGGAMGNGENMINAGLSFALDKGKGFGTSKAAMARKINDLTAENAAQAAKIETLEARLAAIESKLEK